MTSAPVRAASAAVTELSTPPDMATTIRAPLAGRPRWKSILIGSSWGGSLPEFHSLELVPGQGQRQARQSLARHETNFEEAGEAHLSPRETLSLSMAHARAAAPPSREDALACFLSAAEGWDEAARRLDGAFAECPALKQSKD